MMPIQEGTILEWRQGESQDSTPFEIVRKDDTSVILMPLDGGRESRITLDELEQEYRVGRLIHCRETRDNGVSNLRAFFMLPERVRAESRRREGYVREMDDQATDNGSIPNALLDRILADIAARHCEEKRPGYGYGAPSRATARRWHARWRNAGRVVDALVPNTAARGSSEGRLQSKVEKCIARAIESEYLTLQRNTIRYCHLALTRLIEEENKYRAHHDQLRLPGRRAFTRRIHAIDPLWRDVKRRGVVWARNKQKMVKRGQLRAKRPNEVWEVDATCMDILLVYLVNGKARWLRAYLTIIVDQFTRCIVGYCLSFDKPSFVSIAAALRMALQPKDEIVARYTELINDWPCWGVPSVLICDNGRENHSEAFRYLCGVLGIELLYAPRKSPQAKPHVERAFRTINHASHRLPGTTFSNPKDKGDYNSKAHGGLTIEDLEEWLIRYIVDEYHQEMHSALLKAPYHMWCDAAREEPIQVPTEVVEAEAFFMKEEERVLQKDGVHLQHLIYYSDELQDLYDHQVSRKVRIRYSDEDLGSILVADPEGGRWLKACCHNMPQYAATWTRRQHRAHVEAARQQGKGRVDTLAIARSATSNTGDARTRAAKNRRALRKLQGRPREREKNRDVPDTSVVLGQKRVRKPSRTPLQPVEADDEWSVHSELPRTSND
jgi:hypothetical protein